MMARLFRTIPNLEVVVHEQSWYPPVSEMGAPGRFLWKMEQRQWTAARHLGFHNQAAIDTYRERFHVSGNNAALIVHGRDFRPNYEGSRDQARQGLGITPGELMFASVGFVTPYKGYDLALEALLQVPDLKCRYFIVGSVHPSAAPADVSYLARLEGLAANDSRVVLRPQFVDDAAFDRWIRAADGVLLPYRSSTSSSVLARCHLLGTPALTTRAAGLDAELHPADVSVAGVDELAAALRIWADHCTVSTGRS